MRSRRESSPSPIRTTPRPPTRKRSRARSATCLPRGPAAELERIVRALTPHIGAFLELEGGERLGVRRAREVDDGPARGHDRAPRRGSGGRLLGRRSQPRGRAATRKEADGRGRFPARSRAAASGRLTLDTLVTWPNESTAAWERPPTPPTPRRAPSSARTARAAASPGCGPPSCPGRFVCVYCLKRFELVSQCPNCGEHGTISRLTRTEDMKCQACGHSMLRSI